MVNGKINPAAGKPSILIVDDERGTRDVLNRFLRLKYDVTTAEDGIMGQNLLKRNTYDLVLTDIRMPGADGMTVLETALAKENPPPVIIFTAYSLIMSVVWLLLRAPDLAITEAAVGAGVSGVLFFATLRKLHLIDKDTDKNTSEKEVKDIEQ